MPLRRLQYQLRNMNSNQWPLGIGKSRQGHTRHHRPRSRRIEAPADEEIVDALHQRSVRDKRRYALVNRVGIFGRRDNGLLQLLSRSRLTQSGWELLVGALKHRYHCPSIRTPGVRLSREKSINEPYFLVLTRESPTAFIMMAHKNRGHKARWRRRFSCRNQLSVAPKERLSQDGVYECSVN